MAPAVPGQTRVSLDWGLAFRVGRRRQLHSPRLRPDHFAGAASLLRSGNLGPLSDW